jgi:hypothetical protein
LEEKALREGKPISEEVRRLYQERFDEEMQIIHEMGYAGYFLIVYDFIRYAKTHGIPVGPGRGSAAGSLVAYALLLDVLGFLVVTALWVGANCRLGKTSWGKTVIISVIATLSSYLIFDYLLKVIIVGDGGVGKTAIAVRFAEGVFKEDYKMTIGVDFSIRTAAFPSASCALAFSFVLIQTLAMVS